MAFKVGALVAELKLDKKQWNSSVSGVKADTKTMGGAIQRNSQQFKAAGMAMTAAGGAILLTFGKVVKKYIETGDWVDKMSKRTGVAATALSELAYAADISGASLNDVEKSMKKMANTIDQAGYGLETYTRIFEALGINYDELKKKNPEEQFLIIGESINRLTDDTQKAAIAQQVFGRAGTTLLPLFKEGKEGIEKLRKEAHTLGIVFDQEAAAKAAKLKDAQTALSGSFKGMGMLIAEKIVPALTKLVLKATEVTKKIIAWGQENPKLISTIVKIVGALGALMAVLGPILILLPGLSVAFGAMGGALAALISPIGLVVAGLAALAIGFMKVKAAQKAAEDAADRYKAANMKLREKLKLIASTAGLTGKEFNELSKKYKHNTNALAIAIQKGEEGVDLQKAMTKVGGERVIQLKDSIKKQKEANAGLDIYKGVLEGASAAIEKAKEKTKTWVDYMKDLGLKTVKDKKDRVEELKKFMEELTQAYKDGKISLDEYTVSMVKAEAEVKTLSSTIGLTVLPAARDLSGALDNLPGAFEENTWQGVTKVKKALEKGNLPGYMSTITSAISGAWDGLFTHLKNGTLTFKNAWNTIWGGIKNTFFGILQDMLTKATTGFFVKLLSSAKDSGGQIASGLTGKIGGALKDLVSGIGGMIGKIASKIGGLISGLAEGIGGVAKGIGSVVSGIGKAIGGFSPAGIAGGIIGGVVGGIGALVAGNKTKGAIDATNRELHNIWENTKESRDWTFIEGWPLFKELKNKANERNQLLGNLKTLGYASSGKLDTLKVRIETQTPVLRDIRNNTKKAVEALNAMPKAARGGYFKEPSMIHVAEKGPEYVVPEAQMRNMGNQNVKIDINMPNAIQFNGTIKGNGQFDRGEMTRQIRDVILPELMAQFRANISKTQFLRSIGLA